MKPDLDREDLPRFADLTAEFEILRELGRGGTAVVYLARERNLGRPVAIKVIRATYIEDEEAAARLEREAHTVARLQHPNIVMLYGTRRLRDNSLALIMQYVSGRTLKNEIRECGAFAFERVQQVLTDLGRALACAQRHRIVHRDIKPENVYLDDVSGIARLSDFGIARPWDSDHGLTLPGVAIGTPAYMSPEQIDGGVIDGRSDLYSLGLVGYEMLTGRAPWAGESLFGMIYKQKHESLPPLETLRPGIPDKLQRALEGALRKNREERWAHAEEFLEALNGRIAAPVRRPVSAAEADAPETSLVNPPDSATIQYRRSDLGLPEPPEQGLPPAPTSARIQRRAPARDRSAFRRSATGGVSHGSVQLEPLTEAALAAAAQESHAVEPATRSGRLRVVALAALLPVILLGAALFRNVGSNGQNPSTVRMATATGAPAPTDQPAGPTESADVRPVLAWALFGNRQSGPAGDTLPKLLMVQVENATGGPVPGVAVEFTVTEGDGAVDPQTAVTDETGVARTRWLLGGVGSHSVNATVKDLSQTITFTALALPRLAARLAAVSPTDLIGTPGTPVGSPLVVRVLDDRGLPAIGARVQFRIRSGEGQVMPAISVVGQDGTARAEWTLGSGGTQEATATLADRSESPVVFRAVTRPASLAVRRGMSTGGTHTCVLQGDGSASCWGGNDKGQLGEGSIGRRNAPVRVATPEPLAMLSAGVSHTCGVSISGSAFCWGANAAGQLGDGTRTDRPTPVRVATDERLIGVGAGMYHSCALDAEGRLFCWGQNTHGQLGDGTRTDRPAPVRAGGSRTFRSVALGWSHTCALATDGTAYCWGSNGSGELGDGSTFGRTEPAPVSGNARFVSITSGSGHTCALTVGGSVFCWGQNANGQLGNETTENSTVPVVVEPTNFFSAIALGSVHSCALARDGSARCWGRNTYGQLGDGSVEDRLRPTPVAGGHRFNTLHASGAHTCGTSGSTSLCWGYNIDGQLGNGNRTNQTRPVAVNR